MPKSKGLVIIHVDGLGYKYLSKALEEGRMPFVRRLIDEEDYEILRYRCGLPSTTPYCQAGILYGDNAEIPAFRWWDKQSGVSVTFGGFSSFNHVAHKYFRDCEPLTAGGASIATCYPGSAKANFRMAYRQRHRALPSEPFSHRRVVTNWAMNPLNLVDWLQRGLFQIWKTNLRYWQTRMAGKPAAKMYIVSDMLEEIFLHQLTRFAAQQAMDDGYPVIYAAIYSYDETAHAFGPEADYSFRILRHIDNTIRRIASKRKNDSAKSRDYEIVILSDHGQAETVPFELAFGQRFADLIAEWLPTHEVDELKGQRITRKEAIDGHVALAYSGGLAHLYFKDVSWHLSRDEIEERYPGLIKKIANTPGIGFMMMRDGAAGVILRQGKEFELDPSQALPPAAEKLFRQYDEPEIVARQLAKLNSFERSGDIILFGDYTDHHQINFETQVGGHGSIGGEQQFPFILAKREWKFNTDEVTDASDVYPLLRRLSNRLLK